jgi:hypothetical protein
MATIKELIEKAGQVAVLKAHPVGSYFITEEDRNPAEILGLGGGEVLGLNSKVEFYSEQTQLIQ